MKNRRAFTMTELLVVIGILLLIASLTFAVFKGRTDDRIRSAARVAQSAILGAKDRAAHAKDFRGVRLIQDASDPTLVTGFSFLQQIPNQQYPSGSIQLERFDVDQDGIADSPEILIVRGFDGSEASPPKNFSAVDWASLSNPTQTSFNFLPGQGRIRIPAGTGQWFQYVVSQRPGYILAQGNEVLELLTPFPNQTSAVKNVSAWLIGSQYSSCEIQMGVEVLPFHQPILLPAGVVIDLNFSSQSVKSIVASGAQTFDLMFSPRGMLAGDIVARGPLHFAIRGMGDATKRLDPANQGCESETLILSVFPQTGLVQTFDADITDDINNTTGNPPGDGIADNLFRFAQTGKAANR